MERSRTPPRGSPCARAASSPARRRAPAPPSCSPSAPGSSGTPPRRCRSRASRPRPVPSVDRGRPGHRDQLRRRCAGSTRAAASAPRSRRCTTAPRPRRRRGCAPRSPWIASAGWRKNADVPVLESVAAILRQMMPGLAHAGDDHAAAAVEQQLHRALEVARRGDRRGRGSPSPSVRSTLRASSSDRASPLRHRQAHRDHARAAIAWIRTSSSSSGRQQIEPQRVLRVALRARRIFVDFHEHAVDAGRHPGASHRLDELAPARR